MLAELGETTSFVTVFAVIVRVIVPLTPPREAVTVVDPEVMPVTGESNFDLFFGALCCPAGLRVKDLVSVSCIRGVVGEQ